MDPAVIAKYEKKCQDAEKQIEQLSAMLDSLANRVTENGVAEDPEYDALLAENEKLKYRIKILSQSIQDSNFADPSTSDVVNIFGELERVFKNALLAAYPQATKAEVQIQLSKMADYQCNASMSVAKLMKKNPREVGETIISHLKPCPVISKVELSGPGFINITLDKDFIRKQVTEIVVKGVCPPPTKKLKVIVDFSSPNVAKEMHVGHLRSTIIGESTCRLLEFLGHDVLRLNHLGDWGTQFGMLIAHLKETFPDYTVNHPPISDLQAFYKQSKTRFDEDQEFKKRAYDAVVKLQSGEEEYVQGWKLICEISLKEFDKVYERLDVTITPRGESYYQKMMETMVSELDNANLLSLEEGRKVMYADGADIPLTVVKSDGGFTYDTSDMACIRDRVTTDNGDWLIYVTDIGQSQHFKSFFACARKAKFYDPKKTRVDHVTFGVVLGEDKKKFKTRSGDTIRLVELLDEGISRAESKLKEKNRDEALTKEEFLIAKEAVAYGCIKYSDLSNSRTRDYVFSFDRMLDFRGNTAAYLLYALTRIRSIARTANVEKQAIKEEALRLPVELDHEKEWKLAKVLVKLPDVLLRITEDLCLHQLCEYLYELSTVFTEFYDNCYCVEKDKSGNIVKVNMNRIVLCEATALVMEKCFDILGIKTVERM